MGGPGAGHQSERARRSRLINIQKARAARKRAPLPWRSGVESRIIEQLVWQWWMDTGIAALPLSGPFVPQGKQAGGQGPGMRTPATAGKPRPVPFAFRRRR